MNCVYGCGMSRCSMTAMPPGKVDRRVRPKRQREQRTRHIGISDPISHRRSTRDPVRQESERTGGRAMKITAVRCVQYSGTMDFPGVFWEERLIRPVDIYPQYQAEMERWPEPGHPG